MEKHFIDTHLLQTLTKCNFHESYVHWVIVIILACWF